jgi:hypothetical protein
VATTDLDSAVAALITTNGINTATVLLQTIGSKSVLDLIADRITLTGYTVVDGEAEFTGNIHAKSLSIDNYIDVNSDTFRIYAYGQTSESPGLCGLSLQETGASNPIMVTLDNNVGLALLADEDGVAQGSFYAGRVGGTGDFVIQTSKGSISGTGYTGTISGARYVNGICVGTA